MDCAVDGQVQWKQVIVHPEFKMPVSGLRLESGSVGRFWNISLPNRCHRRTTPRRNRCCYACAIRCLRFNSAIIYRISRKHNCDEKLCNRPSVTDNVTVLSAARSTSSSPSKTYICWCQGNSPPKRWKLTSASTSSSVSSVASSLS